MKEQNINTLNDLINAYDTKKYRDIKTATKITNSNTKKVFVNWLDLKLEEITTELIEVEILDPIHKHLSIDYTNKVRAYINKIYNWAVREKIVKENPVTNIREYKNPDRIKQDIMYYSPEQWKVIYSGYERLVKNRPVDYPYLVITSMLYYMGFRVGEALALRRTDIIDNEYVRINKTCTFCTKEQISSGYIVTTTKTDNSIRLIKMPIVMQRIMSKYLDYFEKRYPKSAPFLFGGYSPINIRMVRRKFHKVTSLAELPKIKLHSLRHSHASLLINRGAPAKAVAERLGNTEAEILKTYSHLFKSTSDACVDIIDEEFLISSLGENSAERKANVTVLKAIGYNLDDINKCLSSLESKKISYKNIIREVTKKLIDDEGFHGVLCDLLLQK